MVLLYIFRNGHMDQLIHNLLMAFKIWKFSTSPYSSHYSNVQSVWYKLSFITPKAAASIYFVDFPLSVLRWKLNLCSVCLLAQQAGLQLRAQHSSPLSPVYVSLCTIKNIQWCDGISGSAALSAFTAAPLPTRLVCSNTQVGCCAASHATEATKTK